MSLTLSVLTYRNQPPSRTISKQLTGVGGTIGRQEQNDLVLPDPEKVISRVHARIDFRNGTYFITRLGQNPIDLNGRPLASGGSEPLSTADRLTVGDYCIVVQIQPSPSPELSPGLEVGLGTSPFRHAEMDAPSLLETGSDLAFGINLGGEGAQPHSESRPPDQPPLSDRGLQRDRVPGYEEPLPPFSSLAEARIPDDYDLLEDARKPARTPATPPAVPPQGLRVEPSSSDLDPFANIRPAEQEPTVSLQRDVAPQVGSFGEGEEVGPTRQAGKPGSRPPHREAVEAVVGGDYARAVRTLLQAAGVPELEERALGDPEFLRTVGELLREAIAGLLKALLARALTKRELRVDMTMLAATENNPLKFSPDAYQALSHLLVKAQRPGYLPPIRAVREAYDDLQAHNLAVMAGVRAALHEVLQRLEPNRLEERLRSHSLLDLVPMHRKARLWELAAEQHSNLMREAQDEFDRIFGRAFRIAYEEQVRKMRASADRALLP